MKFFCIFLLLIYWSLIIFGPVLAKNSDFSYNLIKNNKEKIT